MLYGPEKTTLFLGNFGSGKTEVAVNFALHLAANRKGLPVALVDLDLVNPYFRSREARQVLEDAGIRLILPDAQYLHADLPVLTSGVRAALVDQSPDAGVLILDVGGDDVGARVLGALHDALPEGSYRAVMVVNAARPMTADVPGISRMKAAIEAAGKIRVTGLASNTHLMDQTTAQTIARGRTLALQAAAALGLSLEFVTAPAALADAARQTVEEDVLPIYRYLTPPWLVPADGEAHRLGKALFRL